MVISFSFSQENCRGWSPREEHHSEHEGIRRPELLCLPGQGRSCHSGGRRQRLCRQGITTVEMLCHCENVLFIIMMPYYNTYNYVCDN